MKLFLVILATIQVSQPAQPVRTRTFQIMAPQGWVVAETGAFIWLNHSTGASVMVIRSSQTEKLDGFARRGVERIMAPLGFAKFEEPRRFAGNGEEWVQYEIRGNRLSEHRRILYRAVLRKGGLIEFVYENSDDRFDVLLTEAQAIASSVQEIPEAPARRRATRPIR
jgi:hypothetical protein